MGYLGNPIVQGNFSLIDDISSGFDGSETQFTIAVGGTTQIIGSLAQLLIHINGVLMDMTDTEISELEADRTKVNAELKVILDAEEKKVADQKSGNKKLLDLGLTQDEATALTGYAPPVEENE